MNYKRFEDLPVWQAAIELGDHVFRLTALDRFKKYPGLRDQIERATISISNNIAEGFERGSHDELITFLYYALGSTGEVRSMLYLLERLQATEEVRMDVSTLRSKSESISRQLNSWLEALKNSDQIGPRHRNDSTRGRARDVQRRDAFMEKLRRIQDESRRDPKSE